MRSAAARERVGELATEGESGRRRSRARRPPSSTAQPAAASRLRVVGRDHPAEAALAGRLVVGELVGARERGDQVDRRARRRDLEQPRLVGDRQRGAGRAGLEVAEVGDRGRVLGRGAGVGGGLRGRPARPRARALGVVEEDRLDLDARRPAPPASASASAGAVGGVAAVGAARAAQRQAHVDRAASPSSVVLARLVATARRATSEREQRRADGANPGTARQPRSPRARPCAARRPPRPAATSSIRVPRSAGIVPQRPSWAASIAATPKRVASTRS